MSTPLVTSGRTPNERGRVFRCVRGRHFVGWYRVLSDGQLEVYVIGRRWRQPLFPEGAQAQATRLLSVVVDLLHARLCASTIIGTEARSTARSNLPDNGCGELQRARQLVLENVFCVLRQVQHVEQLLEAGQDIRLANTQLAALMRLLEAHLRRRDRLRTAPKGGRSEPRCAER